LKIIILLVILIISTCLFSQTTIPDSLHSQELLQFLQTNYKTSTTLGYNSCRDTLYSKIDLKAENKLSGIYSDYTITLDLSQDPSSDAYSKGINCEHSWPQSMGAGSEPQRSDMHHLFPCKSNVNSSRGNDPFGEIPDADVDRWYWKDIVLYSTPADSIDQYSEKENDDPDFFEPREDKKGDIARAVFYFYAIYNDVANVPFWESQKNILLQWHESDPADSVEIARTWGIAGYQDDIPNPFVINSTLAERIWFYLPPPESVNIDIINNQVFLSWNPVVGADYYKVYSSDNPFSGFEEDFTGSFTDTTWSAQIIEDYKFYKLRGYKE
jgi:endonuclease I